MKRVHASFFLMTVMVLSVGMMSSNAQGRGRGNGNHGNGNHGNENRDHHRDRGNGYERDGDRDDNRGGRGNGNAYGHHKHKHDRHSYHESRSYSYGHRHDHGYSRPVYRSYPVYVHNHRHDCEHRVIVHRYERPRYIYYSDYDVYYDHHRNVYISYSGRNWTVSTSIPIFMRDVHLERVTCREVEYYEDDFVTYLERGRPIYGGIYVRR